MLYLPFVLVNYVNAITSSRTTSNLALLSVSLCRAVALCKFSAADLINTVLLVFGLLSCSGDIKKIVEYSR